MTLVHRILGERGAPVTRTTSDNGYSSNENEDDDYEGTHEGGEGESGDDSDEDIDTSDDEECYDDGNYGLGICSLVYALNFIMMSILFIVYNLLRYLICTCIYILRFTGIYLLKGLGVHIGTYESSTNGCDSLKRDSSNGSNNYKNNNYGCNNDNNSNYENNKNKSGNNSSGCHYRCEHDKNNDSCTYTSIEGKAPVGYNSNCCYNNFNKFNGKNPHHQESLERRTSSNATGMNICYGTPLPPPSLPLSITGTLYYSPTHGYMWGSTLSESSKIDGNCSSGNKSINNNDFRDIGRRDDVDLSYISTFVRATVFLIKLAKYMYVPINIIFKYINAVYAYVVYFISTPSPPPNITTVRTPAATTPSTTSSTPIHTPSISSLPLQPSPPFVSSPIPPHIELLEAISSCDICRAERILRTCIIKGSEEEKELNIKEREKAGADLNGNNLNNINHSYNNYNMYSCNNDIHMNYRILDLNSVDSYGRTALHMAVQARSYKITKLLLFKGNYISSENWVGREKESLDGLENGGMRVDAGAGKCPNSFDEYSDIKNMRNFCLYGADNNNSSNISNNNSSTISNNDNRKTRILIDVNAADDEGNTALYLCCIYNDINICRLLLSASSALVLSDLKTSVCKPLIHNSRKPSANNTVIANIATNSHASTRTGDICVWGASKRGSKEIVAMLIKYGALDCDLHFEVALVKALVANQWDVVKLLVGWTITANNNKLDLKPFSLCLLEEALKSNDMHTCMDVLLPLYSRVWHFLYEYEQQILAKYLFRL